VINIAGSVITHLIYQHSFNVTQAWFIPRPAVKAFYLMYSI
jgi:hypothetical protein